MQLDPLPNCYAGRRVCMGTIDRLNIGEANQIIVFMYVTLSDAKSQLAVNWGHNLIAESSNCLLICLVTASSFMRTVRGAPVMIMRLPQTITPSQSTLYCTTPVL